MELRRLEQRLYLSSPTMHGEEQQFVQDAFDTNWVAPLGKNVDEFEKSIAEYVGVKEAAALTAGTAAIHMAVKLAGVTRGDIVLCSDLTFAATVNPVAYEGGTQAFIDSERDTWNMDPKALEKALQKYDGKTFPKAKAVVVANLYGTPAKLDEIKILCDKYDVILIEDAAESLGALYNGRQTGTFGKYNAISFNGNKIITTSGGGMFLSDDTEAVKKVRFWSTQAREPYPWYEHKELGYNYRMSNIVAGIGRGQMLYLSKHIAQKKIIYDRYKEGFKDLPVMMNPYLDNSEPNFWLSCLLINKDAQINPLHIIDELAKYNIESRPIWKPMHMQPLYKNNDFITNCDNVSEDIFARGLCLPSDNKMTEEQQNLVISIIRNVFNGEDNV